MLHTLWVKAFTSHAARAEVVFAAGEDPGEAWCGVVVEGRGEGCVGG